MTKLEDYYRNMVSQSAYDFFAVFSRFEYAMKYGSFRHNNRAEASWYKLSQELAAPFYEAMKKAPEAKIFFNAPPEKLVLRDGVVDFVPVDPPKDGWELFQALKRARDNLFHGDKKHNHYRDHAIMEAGLFVLNSAYDAAVLAHGNPALQDFVGRMEFGL